MGGSFSLLTALCAEPVNGYFKSCGFEPFRQSDAIGSLTGQINIEHPGAIVAIKVAMLLHVRAKTGGAAINIHLAGHAALDERIEAVIDRGHRDIGHFALGADEHFLGGGVIPFVDKHIVDVLALRGEPEAARGELPAQLFIQLFMFDSGHSFAKLWLLPRPVKIWNNSKYNR